MSYNSVFAKICDIVESDHSVNPISTPSFSSHTLMADNERSNNRDNELERLPLIRGHLGYENVENELDRPHTLRERLAPERTSSPSCIHILTHLGTFHFKNEMIAMLSQFHSIENEKSYLHLREFDKVCITFSDQLCLREMTKLKLFPYTLKDKAKSWLLFLKP